MLQQNYVFKVENNVVIALIDPAYKEQIKENIDKVYPKNIQNTKMFMK